MTTHRNHLLRQWLSCLFNGYDYTAGRLSGDASFRSYHRIECRGETFLLMDAPPRRENCFSFIDAGARLMRRGVKTPLVYCAHIEHGFLLLEDFGDRRYYDAMTDHQADSMYRQALGMLDAVSRTPTAGLPLYDRATIVGEARLFSDWYCQRHLHLEITDEQRHMFECLFARLVDNMLEQPQVFVHRDYHSKNLMCFDDGH